MPSLQSKLDEFSISQGVPDWCLWLLLSFLPAILLILIMAGLLFSLDIVITIKLAERGEYRQ